MAIGKIVPVAPWVLAAYMAAHPLPAGCVRVECHFVIPREEFLPGGMFSANPPKPAEVAEDAAPDKGAGDMLPPGESWGDGPFSSDSGARHGAPAGTGAEGGGEYRPGGGGGGATSGGFPQPPALTNGGNGGAGTGGGSSPLPPAGRHGRTPPGGVPPGFTNLEPGPDVVPEPATGWLLVAGLAGLALLRGRRREGRKRFFF